MLILTIRTDKPEAEIGLYDGQIQLAYDRWQAHKELSKTVHTRIRALLHSQGKDWSDVGGVVCYKGPGSFTGLRIGFAVANSLAMNLSVPVVDASGVDWQKRGGQKLARGLGINIALPDYGRPARITKPKK
mgnify:CR=1 FL=1